MSLNWVVMVFIILPNCMKLINNDRKECKIYLTLLKNKKIRKDNHQMMSLINKFKIQKIMNFTKILLKWKKLQSLEIFVLKDLQVIMTLPISLLNKKKKLLEE